MSKCIVIGGGFAGLSAAAYLANSGVTVHLMEASPKLGGRAYSFLDKTHNELIDNGQHILMGCYKYSLDFLKLIKTEDKLFYQENLELILVNKGGKKHVLKAPNIFYPLNLLIAILQFKPFTMKDKISLITFMIKLLFISRENIKNFTVDEWLKQNRQTEKINDYLWEILAVGALNNSIKNASASIFYDILKTIFYRGNKSTTLIIPKTDLSNVYCAQAEKFICEKGGSVSTKEKAVEFITKAGKIVALKTNKNLFEDFKFIITAIPHFSLKKIINNGINNVNENMFQYSSILSMHIWLKDNPFKEKFYGLVKSKVHWVFNHNTFITLVISNADRFVKYSSGYLSKLLLEELEDYFQFFNKDLVTGYRIIKEKRATFIPSIYFDKNQSAIISNYKNLILAGDWTNTGLPSTIESAVKSGTKAAEYIISEKK
ncbi:15-cis-phytoene desaturase [bacterium BMS3Abin04]|nr:15-cis-phytoene desaturase [bacterium BMS3Abin04]